MSEVHDEMEFFWPSPGAAAPSDGPPPVELPSTERPSAAGADPGKGSGADAEAIADPQGATAAAQSAIAATEAKSSGSGSRTPKDPPKDFPEAPPPEEPEITEDQAEELTDTIAALMEFFDAVAREEQTGPTPGTLATAAPRSAPEEEGGEKRERPKDFALDLEWDPSEDWQDPVPPGAGTGVAQADGTVALSQSWTAEAQPIPKSPTAPVTNGAKADAKVEPLGPRDRRGEALDLGAVDLDDGVRPSAAAIAPTTQEEAIFSPGQKSSGQTPDPGETGTSPTRSRRTGRAGASRVGGGFSWQWLLVVAIAAIGGTALWVSGGPRRLLTWQTEQEIDRALARSPELAVYRIHATVRGDLLHLAGRVPSAEIRDRAVEVARQVAPELDIDNDILILPIPPAPGQMAADASRLAAAISQQPGTAIAAVLQGDTVILTGETLEGTDLDGLIQQFAAIPGVAAVTNRIALRPLAIPQRIYFQGTSAEIPAPDVANKLGAVAEVLRRYPTHRLAAIGYSHPTENDPALGLRRAQVVRNALENLGIDRARIGVQGPSGLPPGLGANDLPWLSQSVLFQVLPPPPARSPVAPGNTPGNASGATSGTTSGTIPAPPSGSPSPSPMNPVNGASGASPAPIAAPAPSPSESPAIAPAKPAAGSGSSPPAPSSSAPRP